MTAVTSTGRPTTAPVRVRPMQADEEPTVHAIAARAFDPFDRLLFSTRGRETLVAVTDDDRPVGGVVLHATGGGRLGPLGVVHFIFADPDVRIPGIGTALRDAADARFAELGCTETSARIDAVNSASQALHRSGGYRPVPVRDQLRRWGWRLPRRWQQAGHGFDPGMQLWLRPAPTETPTPATWTRLAATAAINLVLLLIVAWRAPRGDVGPGALLATLAGAATLLIGLREATIRIVARRQRLDLAHAPWANGVGLGGLLAAAVGVWLPLTGSSTPDRAGWRYDHEVARLGRAHFAGALTVVGLAWIAVLFTPEVGTIAWGEVRRAAVMLALIDLVAGFSPFIGTAARHVRAWSTTAWLAIALLGIGPFLTTLA